MDPTFWFDVNEAIEMIGETPLLEFKEQATETRELTEEEKDTLEKINKEADAKAEELLGKLLSGGDFEALAKEYNQDEKTLETGGDLGWVDAQKNPEFTPIDAHEYEDRVCNRTPTIKTAGKLNLGTEVGNEDGSPCQRS